ncbi:N-acetylmuramic acid 6-phosphate etherase [Pseudoflavonifractor sp. BIOML-A6]|uniref:N-acetylmuramic acid 6-phosphate etherase n=1 Tax=Lawsonibacter faecis TaxID=2763052 RepID=A0A8J6JNZ5_9FIRM|nr:N-acetylmuramic acid 6-phosphate etherase [Lawsonibacter faecis]MTQ98150.1 N-acetylmuramic acid 6-phosphate etherase [Pseudoflavonifractor sp. BIOML-A16]MTR07574.1 N-acetylmuramic acid 6-phosphate etherase [Pseudoflavonifractor sp. BIOML-A15]MTR14150.1 N-acetylmuramic acid 6-phosphate etherase [Pseudoflavonifractor sp. BIOML-A17]MTR22444.1 N-acetylmuramic acid 6-phosphate etherase [Pseudoflavonifractor sp. BIOML-A19]MTR33381.1 N-acetylmuramic acid 6-phosphate etherase [Pseudoflavonifractor 
MLAADKAAPRFRTGGGGRHQGRAALRQRKENHVLKLNLDQMTTEKRNQSTMDLDTMTPLEVVTAMNREDAKVPLAIEPLLPRIAQAVEWAIRSLEQGGRVFYMGAGTSGRLGVLDAAECPPTFGVSPDLIVGLIAGGESAFIKAVEGAEDSREMGRADLENRSLNARDLVIGVAASGRTPYVLGGLDYARETGCHTVAVSCNEGSAVGEAAELAIEAVVGPEVLTGSTRLKAGTAQKLILNMISTAAMVGVGKAYQNLMVDVMQTNEKLHVRAENIVMEATGVDRETAREKISAADGSVKTAITMILADCCVEEAAARLERARGHVREAIR